MAQSCDGGVDGDVADLLAAAPTVHHLVDEEQLRSRHHSIELGNMDRMTEKRGESGQTSGVKESLRPESSGC